MNLGSSLHVTLKLSTDLQLIMDLLWQLLSVLSQQLNRFFERLKHLVGGGGALLNGRQLLDALHECVVVAVDHVVRQNRF